MHELLEDPWLWSDTSHRSGCGRALAPLSPRGGRGASPTLPGDHTSGPRSSPRPKGNFCCKRFKSKRGGEADLLLQVHHAVTTASNHVFSDQAATTEMEMAHLRDTSKERVRYGLR